MKMKKRFSLGLIVTLGLGLMFSDFSYVYAQDEYTLEEITVTAQKREENLQRVPLAVEAITGIRLAELGKVDFYDALSNMSSVLMQEYTRGFVVSIRGMGNDKGGVDSPVAVTIDGAYTERQESGIAGLLDLDRIEVMMGPQGTLFGRMSTAGVVNIISKDPTDKFEASGQLEVGNYGLMRTDGILNTPINDAWSMRTAVRAVKRDGYMDNGENDNDEMSMRVKFKFAPNDDFEMLTKVESIKTDGRGVGTASIYGFPQENPWTAEYDDPETHRDTRTDIYAVDINWKTDYGVLTLSPSLRHLTFDYGWILSNKYQLRILDNREFATEARLASRDDSRIKWLLGIYYYKSKRDEDAYNPYEADDRYRKGLRNWNSRAVFANVTYPITDDFSLTGGYRYNTDKFDSYSIDRAGNILMPSDSSTKHSDWKFGGEYILTENSMLWADVSTGYKAAAGRYGPEYLTAYQLGSKNRFFDDRLQLNWSFFYYDYKDYRAEKNIHYDDGTWDSGTAMGNATVVGIDLNTSTIISRHDRLDLSFSFLDNTYKDIVVKYANVYQYNPDEYFPSGTMTNSPKYVLTASYEHSWDCSNGGMITLKGDTRYQMSWSRMYFSPDPRYGLTDADISNPPHHLSNATLTYEAPGGRWSIAGYVKNIEDFPVKNHLLGTHLRIGPPRTYAFQLSIRY